MNGHALWAVVPVKSFASAKHRLAPLLSPDERAGLARAMLDDVLQALLSSHRLAGILVVTNDCEAARAARRAGAEVLSDTADRGIVQAVEHAARVLGADRRPGMLVIPTDVPLIHSSDVDSIAREHAGDGCATLVAAGRDGGTNAMACSSPQALPPCYGKDSFRRHHSAAMARGLTTKVLALPRVALDIDEPEDLLDFITRPASTRTHAYLAASGIAQRLRRSRASAWFGVPAFDAEAVLCREGLAWP